MNVLLAKRLSGALDRAALKSAIDQIVARHDALRSVLVPQDGDEPSQRALPAAADPVEVDLYRELGRPAINEEIERAATAALPGGLVAGAPPFRWALIRVDAQVHVVAIAVHHIAFDGWSVAVFWRELEACYTACVKGEPASLPELPFSYLDYANWQRAQGPSESDRAYWQAALSGRPVPAELPARWPRPGVPAHRGAVVRTSVSPALTDAVRAVAREQQMSAFMVLEAAFSLLVARWAGASDVIVGTPVAGRGTPGLDRLLGCFINMLPLRSQVDLWGSVQQHLQMTREACLGAFAHQDLAFEDIVRDIALPRSNARHPLFDLVFVLNPAPDAMNLPDLHVTEYLIPSRTSQLDLTFSVYDKAQGQGLDVVVEYDTELFDEATMGRFATQWLNILAAMVEGPGRRVRDIQLMSGDEVRELLAAGDRTAEAAPFVPIAAEIKDACKRHASAIAVEFGDRQLTYGELGRLTEYLSALLRTCGVRPGDVVAVAVERSTELVVAQVAVLMAGATLLPLDVEQPPARIDTMLADARASLVLAGDAGAIGLSSTVPVLDVVTALDEGALADASASVLAPDVGPASAAYTLFTSGSTGRPKGAVNTHAGIANRIAWMQATYRLTTADRVLYKTPVAFDVAMWEWLWPLTAGARVVVAEPGAHRDPVALARTISSHGVTVTHFVPSMLRVFAAQPEAREGSCLRQIICSGEELTAAGVAEARLICPAIDNLYGPTEAAIDVTWWSCTGDEDRVPIGSPISGVSARIVDETGNLAPIGVPGELLIGGIALAHGYAHRPGLTARAFIPDPWNPGNRLYRTGDRARWRQPGTLEYLGRLDTQIKIRGVRIEPGEIEAVLSSCPGVTESAVVTRTDELRGPHLAAFVSGSAEVDDLRRHLRTVLPDALVPSSIEKLAALPRVASGKVDRGALVARPQAGGRAEAGPAEQPSTETELAIAGFWAAALGVSEPGLDENFFDLGGHSLLITRLSASVREEFGVKVDVRRFFENPTIRGMADAVLENQLRQADPELAWELLAQLDEPQTAPSGLRAQVVREGDSLSRSSQTPVELAAVGMPTCDRVSGLMRGLRSYHANAARFGRSASFTIMDNSASGQTRRDYRDVLRDFSRATGAQIFYAGAEEKRAWLAACAEESGVPARIVAFGLFGHRRGPYNAANNANANILHATGQPIFCADDDTLCDLRLPPGHSDRCVTGTGNPEINWAFRDIAQLDATMLPADRDILAECSHLLGRSPAEIAAPAPAGAPAAAPAPAPAPAADGRVALVVPSLTGDCGWASPTSYLYFTGTSLTRLISSEQSYADASTSRINARFVTETTTVQRLPGFMCTFYALDTSRLVLPYLPCTKGNDTLYTLLHSICFPADHFAFTPLALRHEPVDTRHFWAGEMLRGATGIDYSYLVAALVEPLWSHESLPGTDRADRVRALGRFLTDLGQASPADFWARADELVRERAQEELERQIETLAAHEDAPKSWQRDLSTFIDLRRRSIGGPDFAVPLDLSMDEGTEGARELGREFILAFGELLTAWPDIVAAADTLNQRERPLAHRL
jgi:amino acid adenylation domain-containing protein